MVRLGAVGLWNNTSNKWAFAHHLLGRVAARGVQNVMNVIRERSPRHLPVFGRSTTPGGSGRNFLHHHRGASSPSCDSVAKTEDAVDACGQANRSRIPILPRNELHINTPLRHSNAFCNPSSISPSSRAVAWDLISDGHSKLVDRLGEHTIPGVEFAARAKQSPPPMFAIVGNGHI